MVLKGKLERLVKANQKGLRGFPGPGSVISILIRRLWEIKASLNRMGIATFGTV